MKNTNKIYIILLLSLIIFSLCYKMFFVSNTEHFGNDKIILKSWSNTNDVSAINIFSSIFNDVANKYDQIEIYGPFGGGPTEKQKNVLYVQYTGENYFNDKSQFDINFITEYAVNNVIAFPYSSYYIMYNNVIDKSLLLKRRTLNNSLTNKKFCLFAVSQDSCPQRTDFFTSLSEKYKKVDSCGRVLNNMEISCPGNYESKEYIDFISQYKFMICFENISMPNYFTEKLINSYYCGTIPIYWGCPNISDFVNMDSILYLKPDFTQSDVDALIKEIKILDENDDLYRKKFESIFFKNGVLPDSFNLDKIREKVNSILIR